MNWYFSEDFESPPVNLGQDAHAWWWPSKFMVKH